MMRDGPGPRQGATAPRAGLVARSLAFSRRTEKQARTDSSNQTKSSAGS
jgi:hypothetical protein